MQIKIRVANKDDSYDLWRWRNHPEARKWSFNNEEIDYDMHKKWFDERIKNKAVNIYIAENEHGKLGQARFEISEDKKACMSVSLNPDFFAKGLGNKIIKISTDVFLEGHRDIEEVIAEIMKAHIASQKAFEKAGYLIAGDGIKKQKEIKILSYKRGMNRDSRD